MICASVPYALCHIVPDLYPASLEPVAPDNTGAVASRFNLHVPLVRFLLLPPFSFRFFDALPIVVFPLRLAARTLCHRESGGDKRAVFFFIRTLQERVIILRAVPNSLICRVSASQSPAYVTFTLNQQAARRLPSEAQHGFPFVPKVLKIAPVNSIRMILSGISFRIQPPGQSVDLIDD